MLYKKCHFQDVILRNSIFHWPTVVRHFIWGVLPFIAALVCFEKFFGEWSLGFLIVILAAILPFFAVGWLAYQHWKHLKSKDLPKDTRAQ